MVEELVDNNNVCKKEDMRGRVYKKLKKFIVVLFIGLNIILWSIVYVQLKEVLDAPQQAEGKVTSEDQVSSHEELMSALTTDDVERVKTLLRKDSINISLEDDSGDRAITLAALYSPGSIPSLLVEGADPNFVNKSNEMAAETPPLSVVASNDEWRSEFYSAAVAMLDHGAEPNRGNDKGVTPLIAAVKNNGSEKMVELLIKHGANPLCEDILGETAMVKAENKERPDIVERLEQAVRENSYPDCPEENYEQLTAEQILERLDYPLTKEGLLHALRMNNKHAVEQYIKIGYGPDIESETDVSILFDLYFGEQYAMLEFLVREGAEPDVTDTFGMTPLMRSSKDGKVNLVEILLQHGADPLKESNAGWSALLFAEDEENYEVVKLIEEYTAQ